MMKKEQATTLILIRHGETANAMNLCYNGHFDIPLSTNGIKQIEKLSERLKGEQIQAVYSSDLLRSRKSGELIALPHSLPVHTISDLREIRYGRWEGIPMTEVAKKYPDEMKLRSADYIHFRIEGGGENLQDLEQRVIPALKQILKTHEGETIALTLHGGVNRIIIGWALEMKRNFLFRIKQDFAALNIIQVYKNGEKIVELVNGNELSCIL